MPFREKKHFEYMLIPALLVVVGFVAEDGHGAVELLGKEEPNHLM